MAFVRTIGLTLEKEALSFLTLLPLFINSLFLKWNRHTYYIRYTTPCATMPYKGLNSHTEIQNGEKSFRPRRVISCVHFSEGCDYLHMHLESMPYCRKTTILMRFILCKFQIDKRNCSFWHFCVQKYHKHLKSTQTFGIM